MRCENLVLIGAPPNSVGEVLALFSKAIGCMETNEVEVVSIVEMSHILVASFQAMLIMESNSKNVISWVSSLVLPPSEFC